MYVITPDGRLSDTKVSGILLAGGVEPDFAFSPNSARVAYRADQRTADVIELFTSTPDGQTNNRVSGSLVRGGNVDSFGWAPDNSGIGYIADQNNNEVFELFASLPEGGGRAKLSGSIASAGDVLFFEGVPYFNYENELTIFSLNLFVTSRACSQVGSPIRPPYSRQDNEATATENLTI